MFNLQKTHLFFFILVILVGFAVAQTPPNPGHGGDQIRVNGVAGYPTLTVWSATIQTDVWNLLTRVGNLETNAPQISPGPAVYAGTYQWTPSTSGIITHSLSASIPEYYFNGIHQIRFRWRNTASPSAWICPENQDVICGNGNPAGNSWSCTCALSQGGNPTQPNQLSTVYTLAANGCPQNVPNGFTNWATFHVQGGASNIANTGFSSITVEFCHSSQNYGTADIDIYVVPYVLTSNGKRFGVPNSI
jgi:hypothetical protein